MEERIPPHHHPFDDCDGCRRTQEMLSDIVAAKLKYFEAVEEIVRELEANPAVKEARSQGTFKEQFVDYMNTHPEMWDDIEAFNAAYQKLESENQSSA